MEIVGHVEDSSVKVTKRGSFGIVNDICHYSAANRVHFKLS